MVTRRNSCTCVYATARNTASVRHGAEMGGYVKQMCEHCTAQKHDVWPCQHCLRSPRRYRVTAPWITSAPFPDLVNVWADITPWTLDANAESAEHLRRHLRDCGLAEGGDCLITQIGG